MLLALVSVGASAQSAKLHFRKASAAYEPSFMDNAKVFAAFIDNCNERAVSPDTIYISTGTSPEGSSEYNQKLSDRRAETIKGLLMREPVFANSVFVIKSKGIDWEGLVELVRGADGMPYQSEMLDILCNTPETFVEDGKLVEGRKRSMAELRSGEPYSWMNENLFPELRASGSSIKCRYNSDYDASLPLVKSSSLSDIARSLDELRLKAAAEYEIPEAEADYKTRSILVKTNLLTDVALIPGIGIEIPLKNRFSLGADWNYAWWTDQEELWWRYYGGDLYFRKWFGGKDNDSFSGHHIGLYGQMMTYDFELGGKGVQAPHWNYAAGVEYGWSLPLNHGFHLEFNIGVGSMWGQYMDYIPEWNEYPHELHYVWQTTYKTHYFGPTKAEINLVKTISWQTNRKSAQ